MCDFPAPGGPAKTILLFSDSRLAYLWTMLNGVKVSKAKESARPSPSHDLKSKQTTNYDELILVPIRVHG